MRTREERRVAEAIKKALESLGIESRAEFPQIHIRANHYINVEDFDKNFMLCIPIEESHRMCFKSRSQYAYVYALSLCNKANNIARKGDIAKASKLFKQAIAYFIARSSTTVIERKIAPRTFQIEVVKLEEW
jgi:hypothetical protein